MHTEPLHKTLSPQAYAALLDGLQRQALQERRLAQRAFGQAWWRPMWRHVQRLRLPHFPGHPQSV